MSHDTSSIAHELAETRQLTLDLVALANDSELCRSYDPDFSPIGWHLGHIVTFEAIWVLERACRRLYLTPRYRQLFDPRKNAKPNRIALPSREELLSFAAEVRAQTLDLLDDGRHDTRDLTRDLYVFRFVLAHEQQHAETVATVLRMRDAESRARSAFPCPHSNAQAQASFPIVFDTVEAIIGSDDPVHAYDNERHQHAVRLRPFALDAHPVTNADWLTFIGNGGYARREWWTDAGWAWRASSGVTRPSTWTEGDPQLRALGGDIALPLSHPVEGVSAHEADAYARSVGRRLPTEAEWEHAARSAASVEPRIGARCGGTRAVGTGPDLIGNVWEWTSSNFVPYPGFSPHPYEGYSKPYFDGRHRVLRGGSWATQSANARPSFRNWYQPEWRAMFAGLRCARDV